MLDTWAPQKSVKARRLTSRVKPTKFKIEPLLRRAELPMFLVAARSRPNDATCQISHE